MSAPARNNEIGNEVVKNYKPAKAFFDPVIIIHLTDGSESKSLRAATTSF